ncbi:hypothetical protein SAMN05216421_1528 [Halopseudomonas xinjiangensis]|uniref:Uncharacterized protein n=1 Tax=Halopseudomonas xinjiangensis TaxID=487184 RepID=A0A1H1S830_9GAMM|nr:hypothetical protein [Halopseudomonas xinjiangensis]SDS44135.1 hypothetical protein SAMN05216421_1528 [Halopseudomonas xinjiangensis]
MNAAPKPLLTEAVMFFSERGIGKEMLYPEFEALLDGLMATPDFADETMEAVFLQINNRLQIRAAVFFTLDFDEDGYVNRLWNLPLRSIAEKAGRGPDMGGGPIRLVCLGFTNQTQYKPHLWKPGQRNGRSDLVWLKEAVRRNALGIVGEDEEARALLASERLQVAAEDAWYGGGNSIETVRLGSAEESEDAPEPEAVAAEVQQEREEFQRKAALYTRQIQSLQEQLRAMQSAHQAELERLREEHTDHLKVAQGELMDIKQELASQQKANAALKRDLSRLQTRSSVE